MYFLAELGKYAVAAFMASATMPGTELGDQTPSDFIILVDSGYDFDDFNPIPRNNKAIAELENLLDSALYSIFDTLSNQELLAGEKSLSGRQGDVYENNLPPNQNSVLAREILFPYRQALNTSYEGIPFETEEIGYCSSKSLEDIYTTTSRKLTSYAYHNPEIIDRSGVTPQSIADIVSILNRLKEFNAEQKEKPNCPQQNEPDSRPPAFV